MNPHCKAAIEQLIKSAEELARAKNHEGALLALSAALRDFLNEASDGETFNR